MGVEWLTHTFVCWSRKSWVGHDEAADFLGALEATHGLLTRALKRALRRDFRNTPVQENVVVDAYRAEQAARSDIFLCFCERCIRTQICCATFHYTALHRRRCLDRYVSNLILES